MWKEVKDLKTWLFATSTSFSNSPKSPSTAQSTLHGHLIVLHVFWNVLLEQGLEIADPSRSPPCPEKEEITQWSEPAIL